MNAIVLAQFGRVYRAPDFRNTDYTTALRILAASRALTGRQEDAQKAVARLSRVDPASRISNLRDRVPLRQPEHLARFEGGLRKAGLPE